MALSDLRDLRARARRAYEVGRLRWALEQAWPVFPLLAVAFALGQPRSVTLAFGSALLFAAGALRWIGGPWARAVPHGMVAGSAPLLLPCLFQGDCSVCLGSVCWSGCLMACVGGGLLAGAWIGACASRLQEGRLAFTLSGAAVAALTGSMGCVLAGMFGIAGMVAGLALTATPFLMVRTREA